MDTSIIRPDAVIALASHYAEAKSRQDVAAALEVCAEDFVLDTIPFGLRSRDRAETAMHLTAFFTAFPDYGVVAEQVVAQDGAVACWGTATMTMAGSMLDLAPTGRTARHPFVSIFAVRNGRLAMERYFFDLADLCQQLGLPIDRVQASLASFRETSHEVRP
jgi:steroid delta-isomerase-like uncharacterized protein